MDTRESKYEKGQIITPHGAKQTDLDVRCDLLPATALLTVSQVLCHATKLYPINNWRNIDVADHINHGMYHLLMLLENKEQSNEEKLKHISHAACRILFSLELMQIGDYNGNSAPTST